jgi:hypothetical protein
VKCGNVVGKIFVSKEYVHACKGGRGIGYYITRSFVVYTAAVFLRGKFLLDM